MIAARRSQVGHRLLAAVWVALAIWPAALQAQDAVPEPIRWSVQPPALTMARGARATVRLVGAITSGWHLYGMAETVGGPIPTRITLGPSPLFTFGGAIDAAPPHRVFDANFDMRVELYSETASFRLPVRVSADAPIGTQTLTVSVRYQSCSDTLCLPPRTTQVAVPVTIR